MLPMSLGRGRDDDDSNERETFPSPGEIDRRSNTIRVLFAFVFLLVFIDISSTPAIQKQSESVSSSNSKVGPSSSGGTGSRLDQSADFTKRVNGMTSQMKLVEMPQNVSGLYRGDWNSPNRKFQSGVLPIRYFLQAQTKQATKYDRRALDPSSGRIFLTIKSSKVSGLTDVTFVFGIARLIGANIDNNDMVVPLKGVFVRSNGELTLMTSYDPNEHLFLEVPSFRGSKNDTVNRSLQSEQLNKEISYTRKEKMRISNTPKPVKVEGLSAKTVRWMGSLWDRYGIGASTDTADLDISVNRVLNELRGSDQGRNFDQNSNRQFLREVNRRLQSGQTGSPSRSPLPPKQNSKNGTGPVTISWSNLNLGDQMGRLYLTQNVRVALDFLNQSTPSGNMTSKDGTFLRPLGVGKGSTLVNEIGRDEVTENFKSMQTLIRNTAARGSFPMCPMLLKFDVDSTTRVAVDNKKDVALVPGESMRAEHIVSSIDTESGGNAVNSDTFAKGIEGVLVSQPCGLNMTIAATRYHIDTETLSRKAAVYSLFATLVCAIQIGVLMLQMRYAQAQAIAARMSIVSICSNSLLDSIISVGHLMLSASVPGTFLHHFMWVSLLKLVFFCVFEMRMVVTVYQARFAQELSTEGWQGLRRRLASLHLRFYAAVFFCLFVSLSLLDTPIVLVFLLYSMWVPQIAWNVYNGTRKALLPAYLYGTSATRLFIPLYFYACPNNFLHNIVVDDVALGPQMESCFVLVLWMGVQVAALGAQDKFGSRYFLPSSWFPEKYDYFRPILDNALEQDVPPDGDQESDDPGLSLIENGDSSHTASARYLPDCIICYDKVPSTYGEYMIAPCDHLFCTTCLKQWLEVKNECPVCRATLPPVED